jgi:hypothetical protein
MQEAVRNVGFVSIGQQFTGDGFNISLEYSITPLLKLELSSGGT